MTDQIETSIKKVNCTRCNIEMEFKGTKSFHEGTRWGIMGELGEMFINKEKYDVYSCPNCGVVEFFVDQVGEQHRPH